MPKKLRPVALLIQNRPATTIFLLGIVLLLPSIWLESSVTGLDEYWLTHRTPMEMLERDSIATLWVNGEVRLQKPPLVYWMILANYKILGVNLVAARIVGVLAAAGIAAISVLIFQVLFRRSGLTAGLITLACLAISVEGRRAVLDVPVAFWTTLAIYLSLQWGRCPKPAWMIGAGAALGCAVLTKGPVALIFFGAAVLAGIYVYGAGRIKGRSGHILAGLSSFVIIAAPWSLLTLLQQPEFLSVLEEEVVAKRVGELSLKAPVKALTSPLALVFPWSFLVIAALVRPFLPGVKKNPGERFLVWFYVASCLPFVFIASFGRYMIPIIPGVSVLLAVWFEQVGPFATRWALAGSTVLFSLIIAPFCLFWIWFGLGTIPGVVTLIVLACVGFWSFWSKDIQTVALGIAVVYMLTLGALYPQLGINRLPADLEDGMDATRVGVYDGVQPSMLSMRLGRSVEHVVSDRLGGFSGFLFARATDEERLREELDRQGSNYCEVGRFKTFYSRKTWLRFYREGASRDDWKRALEARQLENLKPEIVYFLVDGLGTREAGLRPALETPET